LADTARELKKTQETPESHHQRMQTGPLEGKSPRVDELQAVAKFESSHLQSPPTKSRVQELTSISSSSPPRQDRQALNPIQMLIKLK
jgi:hypothetical protein